MSTPCSPCNVTKAVLILVKLLLFILSCAPEKAESFSSICNVSYSYCENIHLHDGIILHSSITWKQEKRCSPLEYTRSTQKTSLNAKKKQKYRKRVKNDDEFPADNPPPPDRQLNRRERMEQILSRDGECCVWCQYPLRFEDATTDHLIPRIKGGPSWIENELAACRRCNKERGHYAPLDWLEECEQRGWSPNRRAIVGGLQSLNDAISQRGGQRKARPYLSRQLRRLEH